MPRLKRRRRAREAADAGREKEEDAKSIGEDYFGPISSTSTGEKSDFRPVFDAVFAVRERPARQEVIGGTKAGHRGRGPRTPSPSEREYTDERPDRDSSLQERTARPEASNVAETGKFETRI